MVTYSKFHTPICLIGVGTEQQFLYPLWISAFIFFAVPFFTEEKFVTVQEYQAQNRDEISFEKGVVVEVIQKNLEGWWLVR